MVEAADLTRCEHLDAQALGAIVRAARRGPVRILVVRDTQPDRRLRSALGGCASAVFRGLGYPDHARASVYCYELDLSGEGTP